MKKRILAAVLCGLSLTSGGAQAQSLTCAGTNAVITSVGRNFFVVNGGATVNDHVWYTTATVFNFVGVPKTFPTTGELMDFVGIAYPATGCAATTITVKAAPTLSCTPPAKAQTSAGKGIVTAIGPNDLIAGATDINYDSCSRMTYGGNATAPAIGDNVEWEGYVETNGNVMARTLSFN